MAQSLPASVEAYRREVRKREEAGSENREGQGTSPSPEGEAELTEQQDAEALSPAWPVDIMRISYRRYIWQQMRQLQKELILLALTLPERTFIESEQAKFIRSRLADYSRRLHTDGQTWFVAMQFERTLFFEADEMSSSTKCPRSSQKRTPSLAQPDSTYPLGVS